MSSIKTSAIHIITNGHITLKSPISFIVLGGFKFPWGQGDGSLVPVVLLNVLLYNLFDKPVKRLICLIDIPLSCILRIHARQGKLSPNRGTTEPSPCPLCYSEPSPVLLLKSSSIMHEAVILENTVVLTNDGNFSLHISKKL